MNKFLTTLAMLTVFATPVFAQSFDPDNGTGNLLPFAYAPPTNGSGNDAFAQATPTAARSPRAQIGVQHGEGIIEGAPAGVDPYVYQYNLARSQGS